MDRARPLPGDVIFIRGKSIQSTANIAGQALFLEHRGVRDPWFSHVAVALDEDFAYEAGKDTHIGWTGCQLPSGARLAPIIDILHDVQKFSVLRSPNRPTQPYFGVHSDFIAALYGAPYSILSLKQEREELVPFLKRIASGVKVPTRGEASPVVKMVIKNQDIWERLKGHLPASVATGTGRDFFCSQLAVEILTAGGFIPENPEPRNVAPSHLHSFLLGAGWTEVSASDYESERAEWLKVNPLEWQERYSRQVTHAQASQVRTLFLGMLSLSCENAAQDLNAIERLDKALKDLSRSLYRTEEDSP